MATCFRKGAYSALAVFGLALAAVVGFTAVETALLSHESTGASSNVADGSSVGDHSTPETEASLFINHSTGEFNSYRTVSCPSAGVWWDRSLWGWADPLYNIAIEPHRRIPAGTECQVAETISRTPWDFKVFTDTDTEPTPVYGNVRTIVLHAGDNFLTFSSEDISEPTADIYVHWRPNRPLTTIPSRLDLLD